MEDDVIIVGRWIQVSDFRETAEFFENNKVGKDMIHQVRSNFRELSQVIPKQMRAGLMEDVDLFDNDFFKISDTEAVAMDPQHRLALQGVVHALEDAGITNEQIKGMKPSVFCSAWSNDYMDNLENVDQYRLTGNEASMIAGRIAHFLNSRGSSMCIESACSSGLTAVHQARNALILKQTDVAIVVGTNLVGAKSFENIHINKMLSSDGITRSFDCEANGYTRSDGFSVLILTTRHLSEVYGLHGYAVLRNISLNGDGATSRLIAPSEDAQLENLTTVCEELGSIDVVVAHGTGTVVGDRCEGASICNLNRSYGPIACPKTVYGHNETCSSHTGLLYCMGMLNQDYMYPQLHLRLPIERMRRRAKLLFVGEEKVADSAIVNSFGITGNNASALLQKYKSRQRNERLKEMRNFDIVLLSAKTAPALDAIKEEWYEYIESSSDDWRNTLYTNHIRQSRYPIRRVFSGHNRMDILLKMKTGEAIQSSRGVLHFCNLMNSTGLLWMEDYNVPIQRIFSTVMRTAKKWFVHETELTRQLFTFLLQVTWLEIASSFGWHPTSVSGCGTGLITALFAAKCIALEEAIHLIVAHERGTWMSELQATRFKTGIIPVLSHDLHPFNMTSLNKLQMNTNDEGISMKSNEDKEELSMLTKLGMQQIIADSFLKGENLHMLSEGECCPVPTYKFQTRSFWPKSSRKRTRDEIEQPRIDEQDLEKNFRGLLNTSGYPMDVFNADSTINWTYFDSLQSVEFTENVRRTFGTKMTFEELVKFPTVKAIVSYLGTDIFRRKPENSKRVFSSNDDYILYANDFTLADDITDAYELHNFQMTGMNTKRKFRKHELNDETHVLSRDELDHTDPQYIQLLSCAKRLKQRLNTDLSNSCLFSAVAGWSSFGHSRKIIHNKKLILGSNNSIAAGRMAATLGVTGAVVTLDTTCTSVYTAIQQCINEMRLRSHLYGFIATSHNPDQENSYEVITKCFDVDRAGYSSVQASGILVVKRRSQPDDVGIRITSIHHNFSGSVITPSFNLSSDHCDELTHSTFVELHGAASQVGDEVEGRILQNCKDLLIVGSVKSRVGHAESASGLLQLLNIIGIMKTGMIPQQQHLKLATESIRTNEKLVLPFVNTEVDRGGKFSSFCYGLSGNVASVALESGLGDTKKKQHNGILHFKLAASSSENLDRDIQTLMTCTQYTNRSLRQLQADLHAVNQHSRHRRAFYASTHSELCRKLRNYQEVLSTEGCLVCNITDLFFVQQLLTENSEFRRSYISLIKQLPRCWEAHLISAAHAMFCLLSLIGYSGSMEVRGLALIAQMFHRETVDVRFLLDVTNILRNSSSSNESDYEVLRDRISIRYPDVQPFLPAMLNGEQCEIILNPKEQKQRVACNIHDFYNFIGTMWVNGENIDISKLDGTHSLVRIDDFISMEWDTVTHNETDSLWLNDCKDHIISGETILPAAYWIALTVRSDGESTKWLESFFINEKIQLCDFTGFTYHKNTIRHCNRTVGAFTAGNGVEPEMITSPTLSSPKKLDHSQIYNLFAENGYNYGKHFKVLNSITYNALNQQGVFELCPNLDTMNLVESGLQAIVVHFLSEGASQVVYPFAFYDVYCETKSTQGKTLKGQYKYSVCGDVLSASYQIFDDCEEVIVSVGKVSYKIQRREESEESCDASTIQQFQNSDNTGEDSDHLLETKRSKQKIRTWLSTQFNMTDYDENTGFFQLGVNSLQLTYLVEYLQEDYEVDITDVFSYPSLKQLAIFLAKKRHRKKIQSTILKVQDISKSGIDISSSAPTERKPPPIEQLKGENPEKSILITAAACRFTDGVSDPSEMWDALKSGRNMNTTIPASRIATKNVLIGGKKYGNPVEGGYFMKDVDLFDNKFFKISRSEAHVMDPQQRILLECVSECLQYLRSKPGNIGVFVGFMGTEYPDFLQDSTDAISMLSSAASVVSGRLSHYFGLHGPSVTVDSACSSSLVAVDLAMQSMNNGACDSAIIAGINLIITERGLGQRANGGMLSRNGICYSFDSEACGYARADGCVAVLLERGDINEGLSISNIGVNHCGGGVSLTAPNGKAQKDLILKLLGDRSDIRLWEAHGTGTKLGDPIEMNVLAEVLKTAIVGASKTSLGHTEAAAGATGLLKMCLQLETGYIPPHLHFSSLNKLCKISGLKIPIIGEEHHEVDGGISSFGISGTNAQSLIHKPVIINKCNHRSSELCKVTVSSFDEQSLKILNDEYRLVFETSNRCLHCISQSAHFAKLQEVKDQMIVQNGIVRAHVIHNTEDSEAVVILLGVGPILLHNPLYRKTFRNARNKGISIEISFAVSFLDILRSFAPGVKVSSGSPFIVLAELLVKSILFPDEVVKLQEAITANPTMWNLKKLLQKRSESVMEFFTRITAITRSAERILTELDFVTFIARKAGTVQDSKFRGSIPGQVFNKSRFWCSAETAVEDPLIGVLIDDNEQEGIRVYDGFLNSHRHFPIFHNFQPIPFLYQVAVNALLSSDQSPCTIRLLDPVKLCLSENTRFTTTVNENRQEVTVELPNLTAKLSYFSEQFTDGFSQTANHRQLLIVDRKYAVYECLSQLEDTFTDVRLVTNDFADTVTISRDAENRYFFRNGEHLLLSVCCNSVVGSYPTKNETIRAQTSTSMENTSIALSHLIRNIIEDCLNSPKAYDENTFFADIGLDSLAIVDFINRFNRQLPDVMLTTTDVFNYPTLRTLVEFIQERIGDGREITADMTSFDGSSDDSGVFDALSLNHEQTKVEEHSLMYVVTKITPSSRAQKKDEFQLYMKYFKDSGKFLFSTNDWASFVGITEIIETTEDMLEIHVQVVNSIFSMSSMESLFDAFTSTMSTLKNASKTFVFENCVEGTLFAFTMNILLKSAQCELYPRVKYRWYESLQAVRLSECREKVISTRSWLITGGLSGIGLVLANHLTVKYEARNIVLISRRFPNKAANTIIQAMKENGCDVVIINCDITQKEQFLNSLAQISFPIDGIIHSAGVCRDALIGNQSTSKFQDVYSVKVKALEYLCEAESTLGWSLQHFIVMSSIAAVLANRGQSNYALSNAVTDWMMQQRRSRGLSGCHVNWGNWLETGMATTVNEQLIAQGFIGLTDAAALKCFDEVIEHNLSGVSVANISWELVFDRRPDLRENKVFENKHLAIDSYKETQSDSTNQEKTNCENFLELDDLLLHNSSFARSDKTAFLFPGQGSSYCLAGQQLYQSFAVFKNSWDDCMKPFLFKLQIENAILPSTEAGDTGFSDILFEQIKVFVFGYAAFGLWRWLGVTPHFLLGHSFGEITAMYCAECISMEDAVEIIIHRTRVMESIRDIGAMVAVDKRAREFLHASDDVSIAAHNSTTQIIVCGKYQQLRKFIGKLRKHDIFPRIISSNFPHHSKLYEQRQLNVLESFLKTVKFAEPKIKVISSVTGRELTRIASKHLVEQMISPVDFETALYTLEENGVKNWIVIGPNDFLHNLVSKTVRSESCKTILSTNSAKHQELKHFYRQVQEVRENLVDQLEQANFLRNDVLPPKNYDSIVNSHCINHSHRVPAAVMLTIIFDKIQEFWRGNLPQLCAVKFSNFWNPENGAAKFRILPSRKVQLQVKDIGVCSAEIVECLSDTAEQRNRSILNDSMEVEADEFYRTAAARGMIYGLKLQVLKEIKLTSTEIVAKVFCEDVEFSRELILEGALQSVLAWVFTNSETKDTYCVPIAIAELTIHPINKLLQEFTVYGRITAINEKFVQADVLVSQAGTLVARMKDVVAAVQHYQPEAKKEVPEPLTHNMFHDENNKIPDGMSDIQQTTGASVYSYEIMCAGDALDSDSFWEVMKSTKDCGGCKYRDTNNCLLLNVDVRLFDAQFYGISPVEAVFIDPQQRFLLNTVNAALNKLIVPLPKKTGVFVGSGPSEFAQKAVKELQEPSVHLTTGTHSSALAGRIAHWLKLTGPTAVVDTACSSSLVALSQAMDSIQSGKCEMAIVCGVNIILRDENTNLLRTANMVSKSSTCNAFDSDASGYVRGEAVVCVIIGKPSEYLPLIETAAVQHTGFSSGITVPRSLSQAELMEQVFDEEVKLVECHMTGTILGDPIEVEAVHQVYGTNVHLSGTKSQFGHAEPAAGLISLVATLQILKNQYLPPIPHVKLSNRKFKEIPRISLVGSEFRTEKISVNSFGFTGTNGCIRVRRAQRIPEHRIKMKKLYYLPVSSKIKDDLEVYVRDIADFIEGSDEELSVVEHALRIRKKEKFSCLIVIDYRRKLVRQINEEDYQLVSTEQLNLKQSDLALLTFLTQSHPHRFRNDFAKFNMFIDTREMDLRNVSITTFENFSGYIDYVGTGKLLTTTRIPLQMYHEQILWPFREPFLNTQATDHAVDVDWNLTWERKWQLCPSTNCSLQEFCTLDLLRLHDESDFPIQTVLHIPVQFSLVNQSFNFLLIKSLSRVLHRISSGQICLVTTNISDGSGSEVVSVVRTLSLEYPNAKFKVVLYDAADVNEVLRKETNRDGLSEVIRWQNGARFVERWSKEQNVKNKTSEESYSTILVTGGFGGLATALIHRISPTRVYIVSRTAPKQYPANVTWLRADVTKLEQLQAVTHNIGQVDAVFHFAGIVRNSRAAHVCEQDFLDVVEVKCIGLQNLIECSRQWNVRKFFAMSSAAAVLGSFGQVAYSFANGMMSEIAAKNGIQVLHIGPVRDTGMLAGSTRELIRNQITNNGWNMLSSKQVVEAVLQNSCHNKMMFDCNMETIHPDTKRLLTFDVEEEHPSVVEKELAMDPQENQLLFPEKASETISRVLNDIIHKVSGITITENNASNGLMTMGIDSLMMEEIRQEIRKRLGVQLSSADIFDNPSAKLISDLILKNSPQKTNLKSSTDDEEKTNDTRIAIVGYSGSVSGCNDLEELWENLLSGNELITMEASDSSGMVHAAGLIPNCTHFDYQFWKIPKDEADQLDPQVRLFLQHSFKALESAGLAIKKKTKRIGIYAGAEPSEYLTNSDEPKGSLIGMFRRNMKDFITTFTAHHLDLKGPAITVYSACSTFFTALHEAACALRGGVVDVALVGAASLALPDDYAYEYQPGMVLSPDGHCRPFDVNAEGTVRGSTVGVFVLQTATAALSDGSKIEAFMQSIGISNDGRQKANFMAPNSAGQAECMKNALAELRGIDKGKIQYVECHGTGTQVGDQLELKAMSSVYKHRLQIGSVKANVGHGFAAAGVPSLFKVLKILQTKRIPPQINFKSLIEQNRYEQFKVSTTVSSMREDAFAAVSSFGIGGTNVHTVLCSAPEEERVTRNNTFRTSFILPISGNTADACVRNAQALLAFLERSDKNLQLSDVASTLQFRRDHFKYRFAIVAASIEEAISKLKEINTEKVIQSTPIDNRDLCFLFAPQGVQYNNMMVSSRTDDCAVFSASMDSLLRDCTHASGNDYESIMYPGEGNSEKIMLTEYAQSCIFALSTSMTKQLSAWGISADTVAGHSLGEYCALSYSDVLSTKEMLHLLKERGHLISKTPHARMLVVRDNATLQKLPEGVEVSAIISSDLFCVTGPPDSISVYEQTLQEKNIYFRPLRTAHGFHSSMLNTISEEFDRHTRTFNFEQPTKTVISNVNGKSLDNITPEYLTQHMLQPVRLDRTLKELKRIGKKVVVQIGPPGIVEAILKESGFVVIRSVPTKKEANASDFHLFEVLAQLWANGFNVDFSRVSDTNHWDSKVPTYQFAPTECWRKKQQVTHNIDFKVHKMIWSSCQRSSKRQHAHEQPLIISNIHLDITEDYQIFCGSTEEKCKQFVRNLKKDDIYPLCHILYIVDASDLPFEECVLQTFVFVNELLHVFSNSPVTVVAISNSARTWMCLGPLREAVLSSQHDRFSFVILRNQSIDIETVMSVTDIESRSNIYRITGSAVETIEYAYFEDVEDKSPSFTSDDHLIIFGGSSGIALELIPHLLKFNITMTICSRQATSNKKLQGIVMKYVNRVNLIDTDVTDYINVEAAFREILSYMTSKHLNMMFFVGLPPSNDALKEFHSVIDVFRTKVLGIQNILEVIDIHNLRIRNFIVSSSLSSILALRGTSDYASANLYMDALALNTHPLIDNIVSIQLPPWKNVGMTKRISAETDSLFKNGIISPLDGCKMFMRAISETGCVAISRTNPLVLRRQIMEHLCQLNKMEAVDHLSTEDQIRSIWKKVVSTSEVKDDSDFFQLGGNSLSAMQLAWTIRDVLKINVDIKTIFEHPVFDDFVSALNTNDDVVPVPLVDKHQPIPLSYPQENMYLLHELQSDTKYNICFTICMKQQTICVKSLNFAIHRLIAVQKGLRTIFRRDNRYVQQIVLSLTESFYCFGYQDYETHAFEEKREHMRQHSFDLSEICMLVDIFRIGDELKLVFVQHHIITDGWSMTILAENISEFYKDSAESKTPFRKLSLSVCDFAADQRKNKLFENILEATSRINVDARTEITHQKPLTTAIRNFERDEYMLPQSIVEIVSALAKDHDTTVFVVMISAFALILRRWQDDESSDYVVIGSPVSGRPVREVSNLIGYFLNNIIFCAEATGAETLDDMVPKGKKAVAEAKNFEDIPFHLLVQKLNLPRTGKHPIFSNYFNFRSQLDFPRVQIEGVDCAVEHNSMNTVFEFSMTIDDTPGGFRMLIEYDSFCFTKELIETLRNDYLKVLSNTTKDTTVPTTTVTSDVPSLTISVMLQQQSRNTMNLVAILSDNPKTYKKLIEDATLLATHLNRAVWCRLGTGQRADQVIIENNDMNSAVVRFLAIAVAGFAYAPFDKDAAPERLLGIQKKLSNCLLFTSTDVPKTRPKLLFNKTAADDLFYIINTSGSTGEPKIVPIINANFAHFIVGATRETFLRPGLRVSHSVNTLFDVSAFNIWGTFLTGGTLVFHPSLLSITQEEQLVKIDLMFLPSAYFNALPEATSEILVKYLEKIIVGGESISTRKLEAVLSKGLDVLQIYGPSECTVWSLTNRCKILERSGSLIGKAVSGEHCRLEKSTVPLTNFQKGELILRGAKVFRGYVGTKNDVTGSYNTGDISIQYPNGKLRFVGRRDNLVKINGVRVDLLEVQDAILRADNQIVNAVALKHNDVITVFICAPGSIDETELLQTLSGFLPRMSVPKMIIQIQSIPRNKNGKVDHRKLVELISMKDTTNNQRKLNSLEDSIVSIASKLIGRQLSIYDDFFDVGGHSLLLLEFVDQLTQQLSIIVSVQHIFDHPVLAELAASLKTDYCEQNFSDAFKSIITIRPRGNSVYSVYAVHAIGGTVFPYFSLLRIFPAGVGIFAIEYNTENPAETLSELAEQYAKQISDHCGNVQPVLLGHSLGGTICREMVPEMRLFGYEVPCVFMFDTWCVSGTLREADVEAFIERAFSGLPNKDVAVQKSVRLASMLQRHKYLPVDVEICLFKAEQLGTSALKSSIRDDLSESIVRTLRTNGMEKLSNKVIAHLIPGDHETIMKEENIIKAATILLDAIQQMF